MRPSLSLSVLFLGMTIGLSAQAQPRKRGPDSAAAHELVLTVGEQKVFAADKVKGFSEGAPGVVDVKIPRDQTKIIVTALKAGQTSLLLIYDDGTQVNWLISVYSRSPESIQRELERLLVGMDGLRVEEIGRRIFIDGRVNSNAELTRLNSLAEKLYPGQVFVLAQLEGTRVSKRVNVRLDVHYVELRKDSGFKVGLNWPGAVGVGGEFRLTVPIAGQTGPEANVVSDYRLITNLVPYLDLLSFRGFAKLKREDTIITANGAEAKYSGGGEFNVLCQGQFACTVTKVQFGTDLLIRPRLDPQTQRVDLDFKLEVSDIVREENQQVPGRNISRIDSSVNLGLGQSLMLSGLRMEKTFERRQGIPLLGSIPILGYLFRGTEQKDENIETVIYITPQVLEPASEQQKAYLDKALRDYAAAEPAWW